jgi:hypothetical protein
MSSINWRRIFGRRRRRRQPLLICIFMYKNKIM